MKTKEEDVVKSGAETRGGQYFKEKQYRARDKMRRCGKVPLVKVKKLDEDVKGGAGQGSAQAVKLKFD